MGKAITVFTPIFNRAYCVDKLYESLKNQTFRNFEWIVLDDGSTDNTAQIFDQWIQEENDFDIIYIKVKNGGKMRAVNKGIQLASAPAFFIVDSDDYLVNDALENVSKWFEEIQEDDTFAGVSGLRKIRTIDAEYDFDYVDATNLERRKYNLVIDMAECYKTEILKKYPSPEVEGEKYISPSIVWNRIAKEGYKLRWHNKVIYIGEYRPDGLSACGPNVLSRNPIGWGKLIRLNIECKQDGDYTEFQYYRYYQNLKDILTMEQIAENLGLNLTELQEIILHRPRVIEKVNEYLNEHKIQNVALYGMGGEAKRFIQMSENLNIKICYGIDRSPNSLLPVCYAPTDYFPEVDAILITNRIGIDEIKADLKKNTHINCISIQEDILEKSLNYYFSDF